MSTGYSVIVDTPPFGVSSTLSASAASTAESAVHLIREGRTVYVSTPDGEIMPGAEFVAEVASGGFS